LFVKKDRVIHKLEKKRKRGKNEKQDETPKRVILVETHMFYENTISKQRIKDTG